MIIAILVLAAIIIYVLVCAVSPTRICKKCWGRGLKNVRRLKFCPRCHGSGSVPRLFAPMVNRGITSGIRYLLSRREGR